MYGRYGVLFGGVLVASCSSTDTTPQGGAGAPAVAGSSGVSGNGGGGMPGLAGSAGLGAAGLNSAGQSNPTSAGAGGSGVGGSTGVSGATAGGSGGATSGGGGATSSGGGATSSGGGATSSGGAAGSSGGASGAAGNGGKSSGGAGGTSGSAGSGGGPAKYCDSRPLATAPFTVTDHFDDEYEGDASQVTEYAAPSVCDVGAGANAVGTCAEWKYEPKASGATAVKVQWRSDPVGVKYAPTCLAAGMTRVTFAAKGNAGGEKVSFGASQATPVVVTLTTTWTQYSISLAGVSYNSDAIGVQPGFFWQVDPANGTVRFAVDDIKYVNN